MGRRYFPSLGKHPVAMGVVDDCLVVRFPGIESKPYPYGDVFHYAQELFHEVGREYERSFIDLTNLRAVTLDVEEFVDSMPGSPVINVRRSSRVETWAKLRRYTTIHTRRLGASMVQYPIDLVPHVLAASEKDFFVGNEYRRAAKPSKALTNRFKAVISELDDENDNGEAWRTATFGVAEWIRSQLRQSAVESPLHQMAILAIDGRLKPKMYHTGASYRLQSETGEVFVSRPGVIASRTNLVLQAELQEFEELINDRGVRELDLQRFFEDHPNLLLGSDYQRLYPQIGLTREGETNLIPDFMLQPAWRTPWCDILDLKLPSTPLIVGRRNRRRLSSSVADGLAQLREYSAFFEEASQRDRVFRALGVSCYRPQMILVIGRSLPELNSMQLVRELSRYLGQRVVTYDTLLETARRRLLL